MTYADGRVYDGEWKDDKRNGHGIYTFANGDVYDGEWKNDTKNGHGIYTWKNGDVYDGDWKNDKKNGHGRMDYKNGEEYKVKLIDSDFYIIRGKPCDKDGWFLTDRASEPYYYRFIRSDSCVYDGEWKDDKRHGQGITTYSNGDVYKGQYKNDMRNGYGEMTFQDQVYGKLAYHSSHGKCGTYKMSEHGGTYKGEWKDNWQNGFARFYFFDGRIFECEWKNGELKRDRGCYRRLTDDSGIMECIDRESPYAMGKIIYPNGDTAEGGFVYHIDDIFCYELYTYAKNGKKEFVNSEERIRCKHEPGKKYYGKYNSFYKI